MTASIDFTSVTACGGGEHLNIGMTLTVNGVQRTRALHTDRETLLTPITEDELEAFVKVVLRVMRAQDPANLRNAVLNKVVNLDV